jgi:hypothetical protein
MFSKTRPSIILAPKQHYSPYSPAAADERPNRHPCCRASSTAACHSVSGNFVRWGRVLRNSSNCRCNRSIGSGIGNVLLRVNINRPR